MKKLTAFVMTIVILFSFVGCNSLAHNNVHNDTTQLSETSGPLPTNSEITTIEEQMPSKTTAIEEQKQFNPHDPNQPELVAVQNALSSAINQCDFPFMIDTSMVGMGSPTESEATFSFNLEYDDIVKTQYLEVTVYALNEIMQKGFEVYLNPNCEESVIKDVILCSLIAINPALNYQQAEENYLKMTDGYTGEGRSSVISLNGYNIHISKGVLLRSGSGGYRGYPMLHVVAQDDLLPQHDISEYKVVTAEPNRRDLVYFTGVIEKAYDDSNSYILEVSSEDTTCGIYYMQDKFAGCFEVGETYTFYGIFAGARDEYNYSIMLDGYQN